MTMKYLILLCLVALAACDTYTPEHDDLDIEAVVADADKLKAFYNCFMDTGSCDAVQEDFKKDLPEVVTEACAKCTAKQKHIAKKFFEGLKQKLPEEYQNFQKKYDPESKYFLQLETAVANA